jgi:hypothetical protein
MKKICPRHEQAYPVTASCPYCEDRPREKAPEQGRSEAATNPVWQLFRGLADNTLIVSSLGSGLYETIAGRLLAPRGLLAWSGAPWRVISLRGGICLEVYRASLTSQTKDVYRSPVLPLGASDAEIQAAWSAL